MNGLLIINKKQDWTSRDIVNKLSKILHTKKIGHTGTLDPIATGVLVICIGSATKLVEIITNHDKEYIAKITLGILTDTLDRTGNVLQTQNVKKDKEEIKIALQSMIGTYNQEVPIYSAVKINGKKLYEYARNNEKVDLPYHEVTIKSVELVSDIEYEDNKTIFSIKACVSKGTYIRSLIYDIAKKLNTIGIMSELVRTKQGNYDIKDAYNLDDIENGNYKILDVSGVLDNYYKVIVDDELKGRIKNGAIIDNIYNHDYVLFVDNNHQLLSIYKIYDKDITKLKPWKTLFDTCQK